MGSTANLVCYLVAHLLQPTVWKRMYFASFLLFFCFSFFCVTIRANHTGKGENLFLSTCDPNSPYPPRSLTLMLIADIYILDAPHKPCEGPRSPKSPIIVLSIFLLCLLLPVVAYQQHAGEAPSAKARECITKRPFWPVHGLSVAHRFPVFRHHSFRRTAGVL